MASHEPDGYVCPFCAFLDGSPGTVPTAADLVAETDRAVAFVSPRWWPRNPGHVLVIPRVHVEDLASVAADDLHAVYDLVQRVARAFPEAYGSTGTSTRQHNGPDGGQDVWHFHVHVFPRYADDELYASTPLDGWAEPSDRARFATRLRAAMV
jgi:histidine triad (HIT) family protein